MASQEHGQQPAVMTGYETQDKDDRNLNGKQRMGAT